MPRLPSPLGLLGTGRLFALSESQAASLRYVAHHLSLCRTDPSPPSTDDLPPPIPITPTDPSSSSTSALEGVYQHYVATLTAIGIPALPPQAT